MEIFHRSRAQRPRDRSDAAKISRRRLVVRDPARDGSQSRDAAQFHRLARVHGERVARSRVHGEVRHRVDRHGVFADESLAARVRARRLRANGSRAVRLSRDALGLRRDTRRYDARSRASGARAARRRLVRSDLPLRLRRGRFVGRRARRRPAQRAGRSHERSARLVRDATPHGSRSHERARRVLPE